MESADVRVMIVPPVSSAASAATSVQVRFMASSPFQSTDLSSREKRSNQKDGSETIGRRYRRYFGISRCEKLTHAMSYYDELAFQVLAQAASNVEDPRFHRSYSQTKMSSGLFASETTECTEQNHSSQILPQL